MPVKKPAPCPVRAKFGKNVSRLRAVAELTQETLAERTGLSVRYLQSIEAGEYFPALATLSRLRQALKCSWDDLLKGC